MVRTYEEAVIIYRSGRQQDTNLDDFFSMGGSNGVLMQCPDEPYTYRHETNGLFELHCKICLEHGCSGTKFRRVSQIDQHLNRFQANLDDAYFSHQDGIEHADECYCKELKSIANRAKDLKVRSIHTQIYLVAPIDETPRFFLKARKPEEITPKSWARILRSFVSANEDNFVEQEATTYYEYIQEGGCPDWFVSQFNQNIESTKFVLGDITYRINGISIPHSSTAVWTNPFKFDKRESEKLKSQFSIESKALICTPLSPNQNGKIGFTNSSVISEIFTLIPANCQSSHPTSFRKYNDDSSSSNQNESYMCAEFGGKHLHFSLFKKLGSERQSLFESVENNIKSMFNLEFNHKEIKVIEFDIDYDQNTAIFFVKPQQTLKFILRHYDDSNNLRGKSVILERIKLLNETGNRGQSLVEEYAAKIKSRPPKIVTVKEEGERYAPIGFQICGSGILEIQSDDGLTYQKTYKFEGGGEELSLNVMEMTHDFASEMLWEGALDSEGYTPPESLERTEENTGARILDMLRHNETTKAATRQNNKLINLGFQNKVLDKSVGNLSDLKRTFSERMEIIRDLEVHTKWVHREGIAVGGEDSEHLLFVDNRPGHKLNSSDVQLLRNGCRIIKSESVHVEHRLDTLPELLMYPETPQEFLAVYLDDKNYSISESALEENYDRLQSYMDSDSETTVYFMVQDCRFQEGLFSKGIEERGWNLRRNDVNRDIWRSDPNLPQEMIRIFTESGEDSTFQLARTYSHDEDEQLFNPHIHQFYLVQYRVNKKPLAHQIFSNASDDVSFYPIPWQEYFNVGSVDEKCFKRYQFLNDCIRAMYVVMNKDGLTEHSKSTILQNILWYNIPIFLTRWLPYERSSLSLLEEIKHKDYSLARFLEHSIHKALWIGS
ncbi:hypothetical protein N9L15_02420 [Euryarchaeota archaeon]|nr:hypothetical protein [Euryarchaeota archaeon]MDA8609724.1 hypothetical protein [Euryarchaeota archaeon]